MTKLRDDISKKFAILRGKDQSKLYSQRKNERNLPNIFFKSQHDTFQSLAAPHSLVMGARGGEAQRADAAARHQGRLKPGEKKFWVQYRGLIGIFPMPGVYNTPILGVISAFFFPFDKPPGFKLQIR